MYRFYNKETFLGEVSTLEEAEALKLAYFQKSKAALADKFELIRKSEYTFRVEEYS